MTGWLWLAFWLAYFAQGVFYARQTIHRWASDPSSLSYAHSGGRVDGGDRAIAALAAFGIGLIWPVAMVWRLFALWLWKPVDRDLERIARLASDREDWRRREYAATSDSERRMAHDIRVTLDDILRREQRR